MAADMWKLWNCWNTDERFILCALAAFAIQVFFLPIRVIAFGERFMCRGARASAYERVGKEYMKTTIKITKAPFATHNPLSLFVSVSVRASTRSYGRYTEYIFHFAKIGIFKRAANTKRSNYESRDERNDMAIQWLCNQRVIIAPITTFLCL